MCGLPVALLVPCGPFLLCHTQPNLTWTVTKPVAAGARIEGFAATTRVGTIVQGDYTARATRQSPAVPGTPAETAAAAAIVTKQAVIGLFPTPSFLADGTVQILGGSCRFGKGRVCIGKPVKSMPELGAERAIVDGAVHQEQEIGPSS